MQKIEEKNISALLIEDDPEDTLLLMELMSQSIWPSFKFTLVCAENLKAGLERLSENQVEVVLLDLMLPDSQGLETVLKLRAQAPDVPIVVLTGLRDEAMGLDAVMHGAQDYLVKGSIDGHALKRTVAYAVERHRLVSGLKNLVDGSADGMVVVDSKGIVSYINPAAQALFAHKAEPMVGKPFPYSIPPEGSAEIRVPQGERVDRIAEMRVSQIDWKNQAAHLASIRDITDLRRIEQLRAEITERRRMDQLKDQLMGTVSHEMRTPLTVVKAGVDYLKAGLAGTLTEKQSNLVHLMHGSLQRILKVVNNILDLSRLESGKAKIQRQRVDPLKIIRQTVQGFRLLATDRRIEFQEELPSHLPAVYADPDLFAQVLDNLVNNAMRFAKTKIGIRAGVSKDEKILSHSELGRGAAVLTTRKYIQFSVIDDGPGIPREHLPELFDKFVQVSRLKGKEGYKGTGLGLAICKEILENQNGRIWVESREGEGTQFHFVLPRYEPNLMHAEGGAYAKGSGKA